MVKIVETMLHIASGYGTITALLSAIVFGFLGYAGGSLTHGVSQTEAIWFGVKGAVFGSWLAYTPFTIVRLFVW